MVTHCARCVLRKSAIASRAWDLAHPKKDEHRPQALGDWLRKEVELDVRVVGVAVAEVTGLDVAPDICIDTRTADDREREL